MATKAEQFARDRLGIELTKYQVEFIEAIADGKTLLSGRRTGSTTALKVWQAYMFDLSTRFSTAYGNVPKDLRDQIVAVLDGEPMTWNVVKIEVDNKTPMSYRILEYLDVLEII